MLQLTPDLRIVTDNLNVILQERKVTKKDSTEYWEAIAYTATYEQMLHVVIKRRVKNVSTLEDIVARINELHRMVDELAEGLKKFGSMPCDIVTGEV